MPKLMSVFKDSKIIECPDEWSEHKDVVGECSVYESETKDPGKRWFYFVYDNGPNIGYFHCGMADMEEDVEKGVITFTSHNGEHVYVIEVGEEMPEDYLPYKVIGHGENAVIIGPDGVPVAWN